MEAVVGRQRGGWGEVQGRFGGEAAGDRGDWLCGRVRRVCLEDLGRLPSLLAFGGLAATATGAPSLPIWCAVGLSQILLVMPVLPVRRLPACIYNRGDAWEREQIQWRDERECEGGKGVSF